MIFALRFSTRWFKIFKHLMYQSLFYFSFSTGQYFMKNSQDVHKVNWILILRLICYYIYEISILNVSVKRRFLRETDRVNEYIMRFIKSRINQNIVHGPFKLNLRFIFSTKNYYCMKTDNFLIRKFSSSSLTPTLPYSYKHKFLPANIPPLLKNSASFLEQRVLRLCTWTRVMRTYY